MIQIQFRVSIESNGVLNIQIDLLRREDTTDEEIKLAESIQNLNQKILLKTGRDAGYSVAQSEVRPEDDRITVQKLISVGCKKFVNNPGTKYEYVEYYLPITGDGLCIDDSRLSAEDKPSPWGYGPIIVLRAPGVVYYMRNIHTIEQFMQLYTLLSGREFPLVEA